MAKKDATPKPAAKTSAAGAKAKTVPAEAPKKKPAAKPAAPARQAAPSKTAAKAVPKAPVKKAAAPQPAPKKAVTKAAAPKKATPAKAPAPKAPAPKTIAPKAAPKKAAPQAAPKAAPAKKSAPPKPAPKPVAPVRPQAPPAAAKVEAPRKPVSKTTAAKTLPAQKAPGTAKAVHGIWPQTVETEARKLAIQKIQAKRNLNASGQRPAPNVGAGLEPSQPTGMYNGIVVTHEIKPFPAKTPYTKQELDKLREALLEERERLLAQLASLHGVSMEAMVSAKEGSSYSIHIAEHASDLQTAEANMGVRTIEEERLEQVESALDRIENNQRHYGLCMACGNKIGIQRLIAVPHAHLCMPCRKRYETIRSRRGY